MLDIEQLINGRRKNLEINFIRGTGPGGQKINKTSSTCQLIDHSDPVSPIVIKYGGERSREQNLKRAMEIWEDKIRDMFYEKPERTIKRGIEKKIKQKKDKIRFVAKKRTSTIKRARKISDYDEEE